MVNNIRYPKHLTSDSTLTEAPEESELVWIGSSSHFLMLRDKPEALENSKIILRVFYSIDLSFEKMDVLSANCLILNSLLKIVIPCMTLELLISNVNSCVASIKSFGEMGHSCRIPHNTINLGVIPGFRETELLMSM